MNNFFKREVKSYDDEALYCFLMHCLIYFTFFVSVLLIDAELIALAFQVAFVFYGMIEILSVFVLYKVSLLIKLDIKFNEIIEKSVVLEGIYREKVQSGEKSGIINGCMYKFFPISFSAHRYKLRIISSNHFCDIRLILGYRSYEFIKKYIEEGEGLTFKVKYLKFSKVLYDITPCCEELKERKIQQDLIDTVFALEKPTGLLNAFKRKRNRI